MKALKKQYGNLSSKQQKEWSLADINLWALLTLDLIKVYDVKDLEDEMTLDCALQLLFAARYGQKKQYLQISLHIIYDKLKRLIVEQINH